jgi:hypothetical protein
MDDDDRTDEDRALRVQLELHLDRQPITGRLRREPGDEEPFVGWLGFVGALKRLNDAATAEERSGEPRTS